MAYYLVQARYTSSAWEAMLKNPQDRGEAIRPIVEKLGGKIHGFWYALGDYDALAIVQMPDNASAAAFSLSAAASGGVSSFKTTALMTTEEGMQAMRKADQVEYHPPTA